jgi:hypothetical protein
MSRLGIVALALLAACGDDGDGSELSRLIASSQRISDKLCACFPDDYCSSEDDDERVACTTRVVRRYEGELAPWSSCASDASVELESCIEAAECDEDIIYDCFDEVGPTAVCDPVPDELEDRVDDEVADACPYELDCFDGTTAEGSYCDGDAECADGSDEQGCASDEEQFTCLNGNQVPVSYVCDAIDDCGDDSDENPAQCSR